MSFSVSAYANTTPVTLSGVFDIYSFTNVHTGVTSGTGNYLALFGSMGRNIAYTHRYVSTINDYITSLDSTMSALYQNVQVPLYSNITYYLPLYNNYLQAIGQNIDIIRTKTDTINTNIASIENNTDTIIDILRGSIYTDNTTTNDLNVTNNTIQFIYSIIPQDADNNNERYSLVQYLSQYFANWGIGFNASVLNRKSTRYENYYVYAPQNE